MEMKVYVQKDGKIVIRWPKGTIPDENTIKNLYEALLNERNKGSAA